MTNEVSELLPYLNERERAEMDSLITITETPKPWTPQPGPQTLAYDSEADWLGYGGAAGGGKSDLLLGLAGNKHRNSIIYRRMFPQLREMIERSREIYNSVGDSHLKDSFNEQLHLWRLASNRRVEFGSMQYEQDKKNYQGRPHDLYAFDEAPQFSLSQIRFVTAWNRSTLLGQRCRVVLTFNPPLDDSEDWIAEFFKPWLAYLFPDVYQHPNPAAPGELRWYAMVDGKETERPDSKPFWHKEKLLTPKSRSFIPAKLEDNPILARTGYGATIDLLPDEIRQAFQGNFGGRRGSNPMQVIPTEWVRAAQTRWAPDGRLSLLDCPRIPNWPGPGKQSALGVDVAHGGADHTVIAPLHGSWFAELIKYPGSETPDGKTAAGLAVAALDDGKAMMGVDMIGYGASAYEVLRESNVPVLGINFGEGTDATDKSGMLRMRNVRAAAYWKFREALDPDNGSEVALPNDPELLADLCAPTWSFDRGSGKVLVEPKDDIKTRLGRSPDCGDAVVLAWWAAGEAGPLWFAAG